MVEENMLYLWISDRELPKLQSGKRRFERRIDERTADDIRDALRAQGTQAAALAMDHLRVDVEVAMRVLAGAHGERSRIRRALEAKSGERRR
jgi:hypothetical protein